MRKRLEIAMILTCHRPLAHTLACASLLFLGACRIEVRESASGGTDDVDIRSPFGHVRVRSEVDASATGLPLYPGARPVSDDDNRSADVNVGNRWFGVNVVAVTFESGDDVNRIVDFYKHEMRKYGDVTECRGDLDFRGHSRRPVCRPEAWSDEIQLVVGTEDRHRAVAVKPRGDGSELALVYVQTRG